MSIIKITKAMCSPHSITISLSEPLIHYDSHYSPPAEIKHIKVLTLFTKLSSKSQLQFTNQNFSTILCFFWRFDSHRPNPPFRARFLLKWSELRWETGDRGARGGSDNVSSRSAFVPPKTSLIFPPPLPHSFIKLASTTDSLEILVKDNDHERHSLSMEQE